MIETVFIPAISGYLFLRTMYYFRTQINRESGYHVLFRSGIVGVLAYPFSYYIYHALPTDYQPPVSFFVFGLISLSLCYLAAKFCNLFYREEKAEIRSAENSGDFLGLLIYDCIQRVEMLEVTLKNRKVYVGIPADSSVGRTSRDQFIRILPLLSGVRTKEDLTVNFTTNYKRFGTPDGDRYLELRGLSLEDLTVVISKQEVLSARIFDPGVYSIFRDDEQRPPI